MYQTSYCSTDFGCFEVVGSEAGIRKVQLTDEVAASSEKTLPVITDCMAQLKAYLEGDLKDFDVPLDWAGASDFNQSVWTALLRIPYGHTSTYSAIADQLNKPKAVRAVGLANKYNPIAIIVPCHRVIAKSGHLQGYFYGLDMKRRLLELENPMSFARQGSLFG
ncbi:MAG: methylated-DNA--[protein]-cysteine S-methyltransferase [Bacteroidota bacterium]